MFPAASIMPVLSPTQRSVSMNLGKIVQFFKEVRVELGKVTWPNRDELIGSTIIVVVLSLILSVYIGLLDFVLSHVLGRIIR
jgi:preprotein translocase subunit SecE